MFLNFYNLLILDHIAPGALFALIAAWLIASWSTRHFALKEAHTHANRLQLADEDRQNFLEWRIAELLHEAQDKVGPTTGVLFTFLMLTFVATGLITCSGIKERRDVPARPTGQSQQQSSVGITTSTGFEERHP